MSKTGPIILLDDDPEDHQIFNEALNELGITNELLFFDKCPEALHYLKQTTTQPFVIFCDMNMPVRTGLEFKRLIDADPELRRRAIPFIFFATVISQEEVDEAYLHLNIQGYFKKPSTFTEVKILIVQILNYWLLCNHPNSNSSDIPSYSRNL